MAGYDAPIDTASHTKATYLSAQYRRLAGRRGEKRALVAAGHTLRVLSYHLLREGTTDAESGADYFERLDTDRLARTLVRRLERLGHAVVLKPKEPAAGSGRRREKRLPTIQVRRCSNRRGTARGNCARSK